MEQALFEKMKNVMYTAYYIAKEELPFSLFPSLHGRIQKTGGKLPDCYDSDKVCARYVLPSSPTTVNCDFFPVKEKKKQLNLFVLLTAS